MTSQADRKNGITGNLGIKVPVRCGTTANITLSGLQTIDGITVVADDRVLVKNQSNATENGIYIASSSTWQRATDFDGTNDIVSGSLIYIVNGSVNASQIWAVSTADPITIGTSNISFTYVISSGDLGLAASNNLSDVASIITSFDNLNTKGADIASASTINLDSSTGNYVNITGTTSITAITLSSGKVRILRFGGVLTLTNGASLVLPGGANITTAAGDFAILVGDVSGVVRCVSYERSDGRALVSANAGIDLALSGKFSTTPAGTLTIATGVVTATGSVHLLETEGAAASDNLDTISGGVDGMKLVVGSVADARNIILKHNTGNIWNPAALDITLGLTTDKVELLYSSTLSKWIVIAYPPSTTNLYFESAEQTITVAGALTITHGLGVQPKKYLGYLICKTAEGGYSIGDETRVADYDTNDNGPGHGVTIIPDATNLNIRFGSNPGVFDILNRTNGANFSITTANWKLILRASINF